MRRHTDTKRCGLVVNLASIFSAAPLDTNFSIIVTLMRCTAVLLQWIRRNDCPRLLSMKGFPQMRGFGAKTERGPGKQGNWSHLKLKNIQWDGFIFINYINSLSTLQNSVVHHWFLDLVVSSGFPRRLTPASSPAFQGLFSFWFLPGVGICFGKSDPFRV